LHSKDQDFADALLLYVRNTPPHIRTSTNEITAWLDACPKSFTGKFYVFGFYLNKRLVGYSEAAYFPIDQVLTFDYIAVDEAFRRNNVFFEFVDHLKHYFEQQHPEFRYALAEVAYGVGQEYPSQDSRLLIRLLKLQGFKIIRSPYFQPRLSLNQPDTEMKADLLVYSPDSSDVLPSETFLGFVTTLYYNYYLPWKAMNTPKSSAAYQRHIDKLFRRVELAVGRKRTIPINGHATSLQAVAIAPESSMHRETLKFASVSLVVIGVVAATLLALQATFHLSVPSIAAVLFAVVVAYVAAASIVSKEARSVLSQLSKIARHLFGRTANDLTPIVTQKARAEVSNQDAQDELQA
jgi:hypothetical protein